MTDNKRLLELAIHGLELEQARITQELQDLRQRLGGAPRTRVTRSRTRTSPNKGRTMSEAQKRKIARAMKARWAQRRKAAA
jgi:hypothetical protein